MNTTLLNSRSEEATNKAEGARRKKQYGRNKQSDAPAKQKAVEMKELQITEPFKETTSDWGKTKNPVNNYTEIQSNSSEDHIREITRLRIKHDKTN